MAPLVTALIGAVTQEGIKRISKTKVAAHGMGANALTMVNWDAVGAGDPTAIGQLVALGVTWGLTLWGRGKKG